MRGLGFAFVALIAGMAGCASDDGSVAGREPTVSVRGVVSMDGQPLAGVTVLFHSQSVSRTASGRTDASGRFTLSTFDPGDGAVVGLHKVTVQKVEHKTTPHPDGEPFPPTVEEIWHTPKPYADVETTPLEANINAEGETDLQLRLDPDASQQ